jgi:hypothetical protein
MIATPSDRMPVRRAKSPASKSPPSQRDFEVYRFIKIEHHSTRQAASQFNISQSRVRQVLAGIVDYLVDSVPVDEEGKSLERLQVAEQLAREQLEFLYGQAIEWWQQSVHDWRTGSALPKPSFLALAARITMCMARVPVHAPPRWSAEGDERDELRGLAEVPTASGTPTPQFEHPPVEDCSAPAVSRGATAASLPQPESGSDVPETSCRTLEEIKAEARRSFLRPAQAEVSLDLESPASGDDESPADDPPRGRPPLNRKERRARERMRQRMLAKR